MMSFRIFNQINGLNDRSGLSLLRCFYIYTDLTSFKSLNKLLNLYVDSFFKTPFAKPEIF